MTDRELLEAAARAVGIDIDAPVWTPGSTQPFFAGGRPWNPLTDDGDAFRLAVALRMEVTVKPEHTWADIGSGAAIAKEPHGFDPCAATRRAIVRAAAALDRA